MAGGVDQVEDVLLTVVALVVKSDGLGLDGDAPLPLQIHGVEKLLTHLSLADGAGALEETVGEGRLAMVDMGDD